MKRNKSSRLPIILMLAVSASAVLILAASIKRAVTADMIKNAPELSYQGISSQPEPGLVPLQTHNGYHLASRSGGKNQSPLLDDAYGKLPLSFEVNQGQAPDEVKFLSRGQACSIFLTSTEAVLRFANADLRLPNDKTDCINGLNNGDPLHLSVPLDFHQFAKVPNRPNRKSAIGNRKSETVRIKLVGANPEAEVEGVDMLPGISNYFIGNDPEKWRKKIPNYARVQYKNVFPRIDLAYYGNQRQLEYDFVVAPGADFSQMQLAFEGAERIYRGNDGELVLETGDAELRMMAPHVYQIANGRKQELIGKYVFKDGNRIGFAVEGYNPTLALVIDPEFVYLMSFGGQGNAYGLDIQVDSSGSAYVVGSTASLDFPTQNGFQSTPGGGTCGDLVNYPCSDAFVSKINPEGNGFTYSTYLGGKGDDVGTSLALDSTGNAYLTGSTNSPDFPTKNAIFPTLRDGGENCQRDQVGDAFVMKLNASGNALVFSTYLGGGCGEVGTGIAIDGAQSVFVTGTTSSQTFSTTPGVFQNRPGGNAGTNGFLTKLNPSGNALAYSTFLGPAESFNATMPNSIFVDPPGNAYVTGKTAAPDFPTTSGALQRQPGGSFDTFIMKVNVSGSALVYSTFLGGSNDDEGHGLFVDSAGNAYVTGTTSSKNFPVTPGSFQDHFDQFGGFVAKLTSNGSSLVYSTLGLGGADIVADSQGNAYVAGGTFGGAGGKLSPSGSTLEGVLPRPPDGFGNVMALSLDSMMNVYTTGYAPSLVPCGGQSVCDGPYNVFVEKISSEMLAQSGQSSLFLPVVLSLGGQNGSFYTSELSFTNAGSQQVTLALNYTAAIGEGTGSVSVTVPAGHQLIVPDAIDFLRTSGIPIPTTGGHAGTLRVEYRSLIPEQISILARTTTQNALGKAGLSYYAVPPNLLLTDTCYLPGLRQDSIDRSNVALQNAGTLEDGEVVLRVTILSGDPSDPYSLPLPDQHLAPGAFVQFNSILSLSGRANANGYVRVERISGSAPYYAYAVINNQISSDGSFVPPVVSSSLAAGTTDSRVCDPGTRPCYLTLDFIVPAIVKTAEFASELIVTNVGSAASTLCIDYVADAISAPNKTAHFTLELGAQQQVLIPDLVDYLRTHEVGGLENPTGYAGALFVKIVAEDVTHPGVFVSARTYSIVDQGMYGVFYTGRNPAHIIPPEGVVLPGLQQNSENRSNLAIINTGEFDCQSDGVFKVEIFNGESGELAATIENIVLHPKEWKQFNRILDVYAPGVQQAYIRVIKTAGSNPFVAYAVINDGAVPGERTGDGAFIASSP